ncbi:MAG: extensin family protein [Rhodobacteraceae bacterium]|nr:extensin family protein [Paracoccaceae bacterium]
MVRVASNTPKISSRPGSICGDSGIRGEVLAPIAGKFAGCGVANPVRVISIDGVALSQQSIMDCTTARTLRGWVSDSLKPTVGRRGGGVDSLKVAAHYSCRTRNSQPGAKISEHGKGHAIDIAAVQLKNGDSISVLKGWNNRRDKKLLVALHSSACRRFGTVLGPNSDRFHRDHFHFDTARYRSGSYCR